MEGTFSNITIDEIPGTHKMYLDGCSCRGFWESQISMRGLTAGYVAAVIGGFFFTDSVICLAHSHGIE